MIETFWPVFPNTRLATAGLVVALSVLTWRRASIYQDPEALWKDTLGKNPSSAAAHNNLGLAYLNKGELDKAAECYHKAIQIRPNHVDAHHNLGIVHGRKGEADTAAEYYRKVIQIAPNYADVQYELGLILARSGELNH